jgi:hypothetical protein
MHHLSYAKSGCLTNTPTRLPEDCADEPRNASEYMAVKQRDVVYERWCNECWFNEGKINVRIMRSMYNTETNIWSAWQSQLYIQTLHLTVRDEIQLYR